MGIYTDIILLRPCDLSMRHDRLRPHRKRVIGAAEDESMRPASVRALTCPFTARRCGKSLHSGWPRNF